MYLIRNFLFILISQISVNAYSYQILQYSGCGGSRGRNSSTAEKRACCSKARIKWPNGRLKIGRDSLSFAKNTPYTNEFIKAWSRWNGTPAKIQISTFGSDNLKANLYNGRNEVWFQDGNKTSRLSKNALGVMYADFNYLTCTVRETDIIFNSAYKFALESDSAIFHRSLSLKGQAATQYHSFMATALHELGHALGLAHEAETYSTMGVGPSGTRNGNKVYIGPGEDSISGAVSIYGVDPKSSEDLSVSNFVYQGVFKALGQDPYGINKRSHILDKNQKSLPMLRRDNIDTFELKRNTEYKVQVTAEQNGVSKTLKKIKFGIFLSKNNIISTKDKLIAESLTGTLSRDQSFKKTIGFRIPSSTKPGRYHLGVFINFDRKFSEKTYANNVTFYSIDVI